MRDLKKIFFQGLDAEDASFSNWQDFELYVRDALSMFNVQVDFRKVFFNDKRKFEIDVVAYFLRYCVCIDCKLYSSFRYRVSGLISEGRKHGLRCLEFEKVIGIKCIPVIVTYIDDDISFLGESYFVPYFKLNEFVNNIDLYII